MSLPEGRAQAAAAFAAPALQAIFQTIGKVPGLV